MKKIIIVLMCLVGLSSVSNAMSIEDAIKMLTKWNQRAVQYVAPIKTNMVMVQAVVKGEWSVSFQEMFNMSGCYVTRDSHWHMIKWNWSMYATDLDCDKKNISFDVKAPSYTGEYEVTSKWYDSLLWNYLIISWSWYNIVYGHLNSLLNVWDKVLKWAVVGNTNLSGKTTAHHTHIELWRKEPNGELVNLRFDFETVNPNSAKLLEQRKQDQIDRSNWYLWQYTLTRYYSPVLWQRRYYTSLEADIKMNCWWGEWLTVEQAIFWCKFPADAKNNTPKYELKESEVGSVYACPPNLKLGSKIKLVFPWWTVYGTCRDRWWAIKWHRLDARCWYGDEALDNIYWNKWCYTGKAKIYRQ